MALFSGDAVIGLVAPMFLAGEVADAIVGSELSPPAVERETDLADVLGRELPL
jgi:hypothetical protein